MLTYLICSTFYSTSYSQGMSKILITVGKDGAPANVSVLESTGYERLDQCAVNAIKNWLFLGVDEGTEIIQPVEFKVL